MSVSAIPVPALPAGEADGAPSLRPGEAQALLRVGFDRFAKKLVELTATALELTDDLFESSSVIPDGEAAAFRQKRAEWLALFEKTLRELFQQRLSGKRRKGLRPDADSSLAALRVLTPFDQEKQAALTLSTRFLVRFTQRELAALNLRVGLLLDEPSAREPDNPFGIPYVLDALGSSSRAVYPNPRVWRSLMERLLVDLTPNINGLYIALNRMLADHGVLPEIKAALRARSELRPSDDRDLLATFTHLLHEAEQPIPGNVVVPETLSEPGSPTVLSFDRNPAPAVAAAEPGAPAMDPSAILAGLAALASLAGSAAGTSTRTTEPGPMSANDAPEFPSLDPLMALGTSTSLFATLAQWQKIDLRAALAKLAPPSGDGEPGGAVPLNLLPHIRAAVATQMSNPVDAIAVDVIGLLFDYIFRDPTIAESTRALFSLLQVPVVKAALLDRSFFSDKKHPARQLLDDLAAAAVGAVNDEAYRNAFEQVARKVIDRICATFEIDVAVFRDADRELLEFVNQEHQNAAAELSDNVAEALRAEADEADRAVVRVLVRERLAGLDVPFEVRAFVETIWADYLAALRKEHGADSAPATAALAALDNTLLSIVAKERSAQKARLSKMIPSLIGTLRAGCRVMQVPAERSTAFFETLYQLHMAALKPAATGEPAAATSPPPVNVHDYVGEMAVGTWLQFDAAEGPVDARLNWVSPLRTKYIFTSRSRSHAFIVTPEELAYQLGSGTARLVVEPVALWDRAVSAALDTLAARKPPSDPSGRVPAHALA